MTFRPAPTSDKITQQTVTTNQIDLEAPRPASPTRSAHSAARSADVLTKILHPDVHLAVWEQPRAGALDWIDALAWDDIEDIDAHVPKLEHDAISRLLTSAGYPAQSQTLQLAAAIAELGRRFAGIMACEGLRLRLEVVDTDACRKFHADHVTARLLMTLHGRGTQWIEAPADGEAEIHELPIGHVAIFKGRLWAEEPLILHRSPPIAGLGITRLLLVLDPLQDGQDRSRVDVAAMNAPSLVPPC